MGYSPEDHKQLDTTEQLTLTDYTVNNFLDFLQLKKKIPLLSSNKILLRSLK